MRDSPQPFVTPTGCSVRSQGLFARSVRISSISDGVGWEGMAGVKKSVRCSAVAKIRRRGVKTRSLGKRVSWTASSSAQLECTAIVHKTLSETVCLLDCPHCIKGKIERQCVCMCVCS